MGVAQIRKGRARCPQRAASIWNAFQLVRFRSFQRRAGDSAPYPSFTSIQVAALKVTLRKLNEPIKTPRQIRGIMINENESGP